MSSDELRALLEFIGYVRNTNTWAIDVLMFHPHRLLPAVRISRAYEHCKVEGVYGFLSFNEAWYYINKLVSGDDK